MDKTAGFSVIVYFSIKDIIFSCTNKIKHQSELLYECDRRREARPDYFNVEQSIQEWIKYSRIDNIPSNFLKAVFHKFYLVLSWILCPMCKGKTQVITVQQLA